MDFAALQAVLTQLKKLQLSDDPTNDGDEYLDAFVALGGQPNKEGYVEKDMLIEIIKNEFELTIDMVVSKLLVYFIFFLCRNIYVRSEAKMRASTITNSVYCLMQEPVATHLE